MFNKGKKDKGGKAAGGRAAGARGEKPKHTGALAGLLGIDPGMDLGGDDDFEAELAKITGTSGKAGKGKKDADPKKKKKQLTAADLDKIQKQLGSDEDFDLDVGGSDGSDISDSELLAELEELNLEAGGEDDDKSDGDEGGADSDLEAEFATLTQEVKSEKQQKPTKQAPPPPPHTTANSTQLSPSAKEISDRIANYQEALRVAESEQASNKVRRLKRGISTMEGMLLHAKKGGAVNLDELPPPVATKATTQSPTSSADTDELTRMASEMTDSSIVPDSSSPDSEKIQSRLRMYQGGLQLCRESGDTSKVRRYQRSIDTLTQMLSDIAAGRPVDWDALPPEISLSVKKPPTQTPPSKDPPLISLDDDFEIPSEELQRLSQETTPQATRPAPPPPKPKPRPLKAPPVPLPLEETTVEKVREFLTERQSQYKQAAAIAKQNQDTSKMRLYYKYSLNFKSVVTALDQGAPITLADMPQAPDGFAPSFLLPITSWPLKQAPKQDTPAPSRPESPPPEPDPSIPTPSTLLEGLQQRLEKYQEGVAKSEQEGNSSKARRMRRILKQFEEAITACRAGKAYEYDELPVPPGYPPLPPLGARRPVAAPPRAVGPPPVAPRTLPTQPSPQVSQDVRETAVLAGDAEADDEGPPSYIVSAPKSLLEGLQQRFDKYKEGVEQAQKEESSSKARRMNRIVKQYEEAINAARKGAPYEYEELPTPPGYPPLPLPGKGPVSVQVQVTTASSIRPTAPSPQGASRGQPQRIDPASYDEQLRVLNSRIDEFRGLAIACRKENKLEEAKKFLLYMKGMEPMLELAKSGVRVDLTQVPPSTRTSVVTPPVKRMTDLKKATDQDVELFSELEESCNKQMDICKTSAAQCSAIMEIGKANQFENLFDQSKRDLMNLKSARDHGYAPPAYHYEERQLPTFNINPGIEPDQCEVSVVRCINIPLPKDYESKDLDVYITLEFPFPTHEEPQIASTRSVRGTTNPEFEDPKFFKIDRGKVKSFMRVCKRHPLKISILYKKGMLKRGEVIGTASVNLSPLSNKAEIHESLVVMDGRRPTSCKLEVLIHLKEPLEIKEVVMQKHSWLVLDEFVETSKTPLISVPNKNLRQKQPASTTAPATAQQTATFLSPAKVDETPSIEALKLELQLTRDNQEVFKSKGKPVPGELSSRQLAIVAKIKHYQSNLAIPSFKKLYVAALQAQIAKENEIASIYLQSNKRQEAEHYIKRKKQMSLEYENLVK